MKVKRFTAPSMQKALRKVSEELGPDAVILSNHRVANGVELVAAINYSQETPQGVSAMEENLPEPPRPAHSPYPEQNHYAGQNHYSGKNTSPSQNQSLDHRSQSVNAATESRLEQQARQEYANEQNALVSQDRNPQSKAAISHEEVEAILNQNSNQTEQDALHKALDEAKRKREVAEQNAKLEQQAKIEATQQSSRPVAAKPNVVEPQPAALHQPVEMTTEGLDDMKSELNYLKKMLMNQQAVNFHWRQYSPANSLQARLWQKLEQVGLNDELIYQMLHRYQDDEDDEDVLKKVRARLIADLPIERGTIFGKRSITALVGPTGAGKTTSIGKLAAKMVMKYGAANVALVTIDNYCIAGHNELKTFGQILGIPFRAADDDHPLDEILDELENINHILIDTAGLTVGESHLTEQLNVIANSRHNISTMLAIPATAQPKVLLRTIEHYKVVEPKNIILTKLDEVGSLGETISLLMEVGIPLAYYSNGQRVPDDIVRAEASSLIDKMLEGIFLAKENKVSSQSIA